ncbi:carbohydrate-binding family 9-like protein [Paenibacillus sp. Soil750]|uniref:carbohydrate-binding family 9-like protein n=1 Tax=Paenibacillus sp. Soil750 TaxID=1736398 RepID=UPI0006FD0000|nr:carbohydrate-binding family 9-like protein [Paenibacillus sp. Soil750]KRE73822.1 hypothetical protein ASL11_05750 [Paenibacillus sp. Soil750]
MKYLIQPRDTVCPISWNGTPELAIDHYFWLDNGYTPTVKAKLLYTSECIHLHYNIYEANPTILYHTMNEPVFKDSCVEFFFQPLPESDPRYLNFEMNAAGTLLLKLGSDRNDRTYLQNVDPALFLIHTSTGCYDPIANMSYWQLEISIPFDWIQTMFPDFRPETGRTFRANFYKCGDETPLPHYGCWNRITSSVPDFHRSCDFGELEFG